MARLYAPTTSQKLDERLERLTDELRDGTLTVNEFLESVKHIAHHFQSFGPTELCHHFAYIIDGQQLFYG